MGSREAEKNITYLKYWRYWRCRILEKNNKEEYTYARYYETLNKFSNDEGK